MALVRELSKRAGRPAEEAEVRAALAPLGAGEEAALRRFAKGEPPARPLGPMAWADVARGVAPPLAAAREVSGFYALQAERDTLASLLLARGPAAIDGAAETQWNASARAKAAPTAPSKKRVRPPPAEAKETPEIDGARVREKRDSAALVDRAAQVLTLFAYHRDAPLVAKAMGLTLSQLDEEIERHHLRRKTRALLRGTDVELPIAAPKKGPAGPPVRRRAAGAKEAAALAKRVAAEAEKAALAAEEERRRVLEEEERAISRGEGPVADLPPAPAHGRVPARPSPGQAEALKAVLRELGPRRKQLCEKLGSTGSPLSPAALLARFRAAGLEREFGQRERDLVRALLSRHRGALKPAGDELGLPPRELQALIRERGLTREVETLREAQRREVRSARWPQARIEQALRQRERLEDLGVLDELDKEVDARVRLLWAELGKRGGARPDRLARALHVLPADGAALAKKLGLK